MPIDERGDSSRRRFMRVGALTVAAVAAGARQVAAQQKAKKQMVQYQEKPKDTPKGKQECDNCLQFLPPKDCKLVESPINPKGWCALYAPKPK